MYHIIQSHVVPRSNFMITRIEDSVLFALSKSQVDFSLSNFIILGSLSSRFMSFILKNPKI